MKQSLLLSVLAILCQSSFGQAVFQHRYYLPDSIYYSAIKTTEKSDGRFLNMTINTDLSPDKQIHICETDSLGNHQLYKVYTDLVDYSEYADMDVLPTGEFAVVGQSGLTDATALFFDSAANLTSAKKYPIGLYSNLISVFHSANNSYVMCGGQSQPQNAIVLETDYSGNIIRENEYYVNAQPTVFRNGILLRNGNRLFYGTAEVTSGTLVKPQLAILETDSVGNAIWGLQTGDTSATFTPKAAMELEDSSIILSGQFIKGSGLNSLYTFLAKISPSGHVLWIRKYQSPDYFSFADAVAVGSDRIVFTGYTIPSTGGEACIICVCDTAGHVLYTSGVHAAQYGLDAADITACSDGSVLITATNPLGNGFYYRCMLKTDTLFHVKCDEQPEQFTDTLIGFYESTGYIQVSTFVSPVNISLGNFPVTSPNAIESNACDPNYIANLNSPNSKLLGYFSNEGLNLQFNNDEAAKFDFILMDLSGRVIMRRSLSTMSGENRLLIPMEALPSGLYIAQLFSTKQSMLCKIVAE